MKAILMLGVVFLCLTADAVGQEDGAHKVKVELTIEPVVWTPDEIAEKVVFGRFTITLKVTNVSGGQLRLMPLTPAMVEMSGKDSTPVAFRRRAWKDTPLPLSAKDFFLVADKKTQSFTLTGGLLRGSSVHINGFAQEAWSRESGGVAPGKYKVRVVYANDKNTYGDIKDVWTGKVISNDVEVTVNPPPRGFVNGDQILAQGTLLLDSEKNPCISISSLHYFTMAWPKESSDELPKLVHKIVEVEAVWENSFLRVKSFRLLKDEPPAGYEGSVKITKKAAAKGQK